METIKEILMRRDGMTEEAALDLIRKAKAVFDESLLENEPNYSICEEWFGLEPDYLEELLN